MARLLVGVTGGISAYKAVELVRLAGKAGHTVRVLMTPDAERFVGAATFAGITGAPVLSDPWARDPARGAFPDQAPPDHDPIAHLAVVGNADAFLIAPATANTLAKLAGGHADSLIAEAALAATCPVAVAPAMNDRMWAHAATRANVATLRGRGVTVIGPEEGELASRGEHGAGRLVEPADLLAAVEALLPAAGAWDGLEVLVTAGGTREPVDAVRFLGNRSSGRMGFALAEAAARRRARVTVVAANVSLPRRPGIDYVDVQTAAELHDAALEAFARADVLLMAAAVADFRPRSAQTGKIKKDQGVPTLELEATPDVLTALSEARRPEQTLVGFAAEAGEAGLENARGKLRRKRLDLVVLNDVGT
ncbi:MAG TPA: bifunctional phosphopantothenoylcysteine decarboxylase/phosphopantothenate--cysteine ligase CoaBC, partial [Solirubrobacteraceae bacterium]